MITPDSGGEVRILALRISYLGTIHSLALLHLYSDAEGRWHVDITPYERETASTVWYPGTVTVIPADGATIRPTIVFGG